MLSIAVPWTLILAPLLGLGIGPALGMVGIVTVLGLVWETGYHAYQQLRWDKDWPSLLALLAGVPEGLLAWLVLGGFGLRPSGGAFLALFGSTWVILWLVQQGPLRVLAPAWRFHGARFVEPRPAPVRALEPEPQTPLGDLMSPATEPASEPVAEPAPARTPATPRKVRTPLAFPGRRVGVAVVAAAVVAVIGYAVGTTLTKDHTASAHSSSHAPAAGAQRHRSGGHGAGGSAAKPKSGVPAPPNPAAQRPVKWEIPSDHKAYRTWNVSQRVTPYAVTIPRLRLQKVLSSVGLSATGTMQTPAKPTDAAWYDAAAAPGQNGPSVLVGAMGTSAKPGVFARVGQLVPGDTVVVTRTDSTSIQFIVNKVQRVSFDAFPTRAVYGMTDKPTLRLIGYAKSGKGRGQNVIVYAKAVRLLQPKQAS